MKAVIITVAGISSRFNEQLPESDRQLKAIYYEIDERNTLILHLLRQSSYADKIIVVGGYKYADLKQYVKDVVPEELKKKITLVYNPRFMDLMSGYSLYLGLTEAFKDSGLQEILFVEGDLYIDNISFERVCEADTNVLTYNREPIYANKSVVLYQNGQGRYHYMFNSDHGLLSVGEPFSCIMNSGQMWKFTDIDALKRASDIFYHEYPKETNLKLIQEYINCISKDRIRVIKLEQWMNCNTREDYQQINLLWGKRNEDIK